MSNSGNASGGSGSGSGSGSEAVESRSASSSPSALSMSNTVSHSYSDGSSSDTSFSSLSDYGEIKWKPSRSVAELQKVFRGLGDEKWREVIDGRHARFGPFVYDECLHGLNGGKEEPGYLESMLRAAEYVDGTLGEPITIDMWKEAHSAATAHYHGWEESGTDGHQNARGEIRHRSQVRTGGVIGTPSAVSREAKLEIKNTRPRIVRLQERRYNGSIEGSSASSQDPSYSVSSDQSLNTTASTDTTASTASPSTGSSSFSMSGTPPFSASSMSAPMTPESFSDMQSQSGSAAKRLRFSSLKAYTLRDGDVLGDALFASPNASPSHSSTDATDTSVSLSMSPASVSDPDEVGYNLVFLAMKRKRRVHYFEHYTRKLYAELREAGENRKAIVRAIAAYHQFLQRLHIARDGTQRTSVLFLNKLLTEAGLHPAILHNPHRADVTSVGEWVEQVRDGLVDWEWKLLNKTGLLISDLAPGLQSSGDILNSSTKASVDTMATSSAASTPGPVSVA